MKQSKCFYTPREREKYSAEVLGKWNFAKKNDFPRPRMNEKQEKLLVGRGRNRENGEKWLSAMADE